MSEMYLCADDADFAAEQQLRNGLKPALDRLGMTLWSRRDIKSGTVWKDEMDKHLVQAQFCIVLVSADCLASDMCNQQIRAALYRVQRNRGLTIIPILVRPCLFELTDLAQFPVLPKDGKPITSHKNTDQAWTEVIRDLIETIGATHRYIA